MTPTELMEWQAYVRLEAEEMEEKKPDWQETPEPPDAIHKRGQGAQKKLAAYLAKRKR